MRHSWLQQKVAEKELSVKKVEGTKNVADLMTKHLGKADIDKFLKALRMSVISPQNISQIKESPSFARDCWVKTAAKFSHSESILQSKKGEKRDIRYELPITKAQQDELMSEAVLQGALIGMHSTSRKVLFTPLKIPGGPSRAEEVGGVRLTVMKATDKAAQLLVDS